MNYITYLPVLRGRHCVFVITIQNCKCAILKLGLLRFDIIYRYLYALLIFSFCEICNSEQYMVIVGYSPTPGRKVSGVSCKYYYYGWIHITGFYCHLLFGFHDLIFTAQKYITTFSSQYILHTGCER